MCFQRYCSTTSYVTVQYRCFHGACVTVAIGAMSTPYPFTEHVLLKHVTSKVALLAFVSNFCSKASLILLTILYPAFLHSSEQFHKIAIQATAEMAANREAVGLSRVHMYEYKCKFRDWSQTLQALLACPPFYHLLTSVPSFPALSRGPSSTPVIDSL